MEFSSSSEALLSQAFQNLIGNAVKFRREGTAPRISVRARRDGDLVHVDVADDGIGLEPRQRDAIFAPFTRLHGSARYEGHGLGLAIVREIAVQHGGSVGVTSTPGEGSTFALTLPAA